MSESEYDNVSREESELSQERLKDTLLDIVVESSRLLRLSERLLTKVDAGERQRYVGQLAWFRTKIEQSLLKSRIHVVDLYDQKYDPGLAATPLNIEDFSPDDILFVDQVIEPTIVGPNGVLRTGTITLRREQK